LATEKESLTQQLSAIHGQLHELQDLNRSLEAKTQQLQAQASDPESADDLLSQLEDWRSKADIYQFERDEAQTALKQMEQETKQLRSAIEIYVAQIQQDGTIDFSDELNALRSELDMVRRQAAQDMHRMQKRLAGVKASEAGERDADTAASLQALRQEMDSVHLALNEKEHLLRTSQTQCHKLEDAIEDRDKEIDHLRRKLESLLRKTGDYDAHTEPSDTAGSGDSELDREASGSLPQRQEKQAVKAVMTADGDNLRSPLGRIFRKR
jgi:chromosome segregation ATPase